MLEEIIQTILKRFLHLKGKMKNITEKNTVSDKLNNGKNS